MKSLKDYVYNPSDKIESSSGQKYELIGETENLFGYNLHRIKALKTFRTVDGKIVKKGDLGGWIEKEENLSQGGSCWVADEAKVYSNAEVRDDAKVYGNAQVYDNANVYDNVQIFGETDVCDNVNVYEDAKVYGRAWVHEDAKVYGNAKVRGDAEVCDNAHVYGRAEVYGKAEICGHAEVDYKVSSGKIDK